MRHISEKKLYYGELCVTSRTETDERQTMKQRGYLFLLRASVLVMLLALLPSPMQAQLTGKSFVRIGVVLPLKEKTARGAKMVEFYQGLLLAVDSMRHEGVSAEITALHSGTTAADMDRLLMDHSLNGCDVVFGPLDAAQLPALADYCDLRGIRLVVPFTTEDTQLHGHPYYYMASAPRSILQREAVWYVQSQFPDANIIAIGTEDPNDEGRQFIELVKDAVASHGTFVRQLPASADDMAFEAAINPNRQNLLLLDGSSLKALNITLPRLMDYRREHPDVRLSLFGYPVWQTYAHQHLSELYAMDTYIYTPFYRNPLSPRNNDFDLLFTRWFQRPMQNTFPRYGLLGFDLGYYFLRGLSIFGDSLEQRHERVPSNPYQSSFWFQRENENDGFVNTFVELIHYTTYQSIDLLTRSR